MVSLLTAWLTVVWLVTINVVSCMADINSPSSLGPKMAIRQFAASLPCMLQLRSDTYLINARAGVSMDKSTVLEGGSPSSAVDDCEPPAVVWGYW